MRYTCQAMAGKADRCRQEYPHEHSHSSLDFVFGCCRFPVGRKHAFHHERYHPWLNYRSGQRSSPRDHVHSQSQTQTYLMRGSTPLLQLTGNSHSSNVSAINGAVVFSCPSNHQFCRIPWGRVQSPARLTVTSGALFPIADGGCLALGEVEKADAECSTESITKGGRRWSS